MSENQKVESLAREFWLLSGLPQVFPCAIERAVGLALPVTIVKLPMLTVPMVRSWLVERNMNAAVPDDNRSLMGCIVAYRGYAAIFVCGADSEAEQRFTVAHEISHLLLHYLLPRRAILNALGNEAAEILDGDREPSVKERATAILARVHLGPHVQLLARPETDRRYDIVDKVEAEADELALELVAPRRAIELVLKEKKAGRVSVEDRCQALADRFGLPRGVFENFVRPIQTKPTSFAMHAIAKLKRES